VPWGAVLQRFSLLDGVLVALERVSFGHMQWDERRRQVIAQVQLLCRRTDVDRDLSAQAGRGQLVASLHQQAAKPAGAQRKRDVVDGASKTRLDRLEVLQREPQSPEASRGAYRHVETRTSGAATSSSRTRTPMACARRASSSSCSGWRATSTAARPP